MNPRKLLRRLFKSQWIQVFGPAIIVLELIAGAGVALTGDWNLLWFVPFFIVAVVAFVLIRVIIIAFIGLFPIWAAIVVVYAAFILFKGKRQKKTDNETSAGKDTPTSGPAL